MTTSRDRAFLQAVGDEDCNEMLAAISDEAKTVPELSEECDVPLSTAYRKVNRLAEAELIEQRNRLQKDCKPKSVYVQRFEAAIVTRSDDGEFEVELVGTPTEAEFMASSEERPLSLVEGD